MDLIERYVHTMGRRIPKKLRADIEKELTSLIQDELDAKTKGQPPSEEDIVAILKKMGHPSQVAAQYNSQGKGLIGPGFLDIYFMVLRIVLGAVALGLAISTVIQILQTPLQTGMLLAGLLGEFISAGLGAVGALTIIFALIERNAAGSLKPDLHKDWNPKDLPPLPRDVDKIKISESVVAMVFIITGVIIFNFFYDKLSIYHTTQTGALEYTPIFEKSVLLTYLPFWNILWALELIRHFALLLLGKEVLYTRIYSLLLPVLSIVVVAMMLGDQSLLSSAVMQSAADAAGKAAIVFTYVYRGALILAIAGSVVDLGKRVAGLVKSLR